MERGEEKEKGTTRGGEEGKHSSGQFFLLRSNNYLSVGGGKRGPDQMIFPVPSAGG